MNILITGGAGFIGSHLVSYFQDRARVRVLDDLTSGFQRNLDGLSCEFLEGSILDPARLRQAMVGVDYVFHLAAMVSVPQSMQLPAACNENNTTGTLRVLEAAAQAGVRKLVFSSSAAIYGNNPAVPKVETMPPEPESPYAVTKLDGEFYCRHFSRQAGLPTVCLRYFNVFGPRQNPGGAYAAAVPVFIRQALQHQPIRIHGDGEQTRDFIAVEQVVAANAHFALESPATGVFNVAGGQAISINTLAETIRRLTNSRSPIVHEAERPGDVKHSVADIRKLQSAGFNPAGNLADSLPATIRYFQSLN
jgi:UDP-glucose 4-epimerase